MSNRCSHPPQQLHPPRIEVPGAAEMSTDGEVANALVCKISIRGFNSRSVLQ